MPDTGLQGTLSGMNALTPAEREILGQMQQLSLEREKANAAQAQAAEAQRQQASQELQQQVAAPPQAPGFETLIPMALGNLASLIGQSPEPMQRGREQVKENRAQIMQARQENLKHLQSVYSQRAEEAQKAGDLEATEKYRRQYETLSKALDQIGDQLNRASRADNQYVAAGMEMTDEDFNAAKESIVNGQSELTSYPIRVRAELVRRIKESGQKIMPKKVRDTVNTISSARGVVDELATLSSIVNTGSGLGGYTEGVKRFGENIMQNPDVSAFNAARQGFLATISRATGERGVLTDQDAARARSLLPGLFDSKQKAERKITMLRDFLGSLEQRAVQTYTTKNVGGPAVKSGKLPKVQALEAANSGDIETVKRLIQENPALNDDPELARALGLQLR